MIVVLGLSFGNTATKTVGLESRDLEENNGCVFVVPRVLQAPMSCGCGNHSWATLVDNQCQRLKAVGEMVCEGVRVTSYDLLYLIYLLQLSKSCILDRFRWVLYTVQSATVITTSRNTQVQFIPSIEVFAIPQTTRCLPCSKSELRSLVYFSTCQS